MVFKSKRSSTTPSSVVSADAELQIQRANVFYMQIFNCAGVGTPTPLLFKGQLYKNAKPVALKRPKKGQYFATLPISVNDCERDLSINLGLQIHFSKWAYSRIQNCAERGSTVYYPV